MLGSRTPSRPAGRRPVHRTSRTSRRSRARRTGLAGALAALALSIPVATGVGPVPRLAAGLAKLTHSPGLMMTDGEAFLVEEPVPPCADRRWRK